MAGHQLIAAQLQTLRARLPARLYDELADGLDETYHAKLGLTSDPTTAARAAIAEFGDADTITRAICADAAWRRTADRLLGTGPILAPLWAVTLISQQAWLWPVPATIRLLLAATLLATVTLLIAAHTERHNYPRGQRLVTIACIGLTVIDTGMCAATLSYTTITHWVPAAALTASLLRIVGIAKITPRLVTTPD